MKALYDDPNTNLIRTLAQFDALVADGLTPLSKLPAEVVADFRNEVVVREGIGVVGLKYHVIKKKLSAADYHEVMALFGLDTRDGFWGSAGGNSSRRANTAEDKAGHKCSTTCVSATDYICTSGCS